MAANILRSKRAIQMSIFVVRAFVRMRSALNEREDLRRALKNLEQELTGRLNVHENAITGVLKRIRELTDPPPRSLPEKKRIGF